MNPKKQYVFICTNERTDGRQCCGNQHGTELVASLKELFREKGLQTEVRANKSGCLDVCAYGPAAVVFPDGMWYGNIEKEDLEEIADSIKSGKPATRLLIDFNQPGSSWRKQENKTF